MRQAEKDLVKQYDDLAGEVGRLRDTVHGMSRDHHPESWLQRKLAHRVIVHTLDDRSIEGLLVLVAEDGLVLRAAKLLGQRNVDLAGEVLVARQQVLFVQTVPDQQ